MYQNAEDAIAGILCNAQIMPQLASYWRVDRLGIFAASFQHGAEDFPSESQIETTFNPTAASGNAGLPLRAGLRISPPNAYLR